MICRQHTRKGKLVDYVGEYHIDLLQKFGCCPIIVPRTQKTHLMLESYLPFEGLLLVEGEDISTGYISNPYGGEAELVEAKRLEMEIKEIHKSDTVNDVEKDIVEMTFLQYALDNNIPFLGICRGSQLLNVVAGGSLYYDVQSQLPNCGPHIQYGEDKYDTFRHPIRILQDTPLASWYSLPNEKEKHPSSNENTRRDEETTYQSGDQVLSLPVALRLPVNSYHHQGVRKLASRFKPMAISEPEGLIEGFWDPQYCDPEQGKFLVGIQYHPERMTEEHFGHEITYAKFAEAAKSFLNSSSSRF